MNEKRYFDLTEILANKEQARVELAARSFVEKIRVVERLRERAAMTRGAIFSEKSGEPEKPSGLPRI